VTRTNGTARFFHVTHFAEQARRSSEFQSTQERSWLAGALLILGDELQAQRYFDRGPDLEFVRHLRNGVAHGNRFNIHDGSLARPARFVSASDGLFPDDSRAKGGTSFEISPADHGQVVLFDFIGPGDVLDLLQHVSWRLTRLGNGDDPADLFPQQ
jgi:hypothetical protein